MQDGLVFDSPSYYVERYGLKIKRSSWRDQKKEEKKPGTYLVPGTWDVVWRRIPGTTFINAIDGPMHRRVCPTL